MAGHLQQTDAAIVHRIRAACAAAFGLPAGAAFFELDLRPGETVDAMLLRRFREEQAATGWDDEAVINTLVYG